MVAKVKGKKEVEMAMPQIYPKILMLPFVRGWEATYIQEICGR